MGNDGGSIPKRRELVKEAARNPTAAELKETQQEQREHLWTVDPLSNRPLARPVVSDSLGRLFNKDSIIEFLLPADEESAVRRAEQDELLKGTVKSLKDVVEIKFEIEPLKGQVSARNGNVRDERWVCPITTKELGSASKAVYLVPCGHAFSEIAIKEVSGGNCLQCNEPYAPNDVIPILSTTEVDIARLTLRVKTLAGKGLTHALKKAPGSSKKRKKEAAETSDTHVLDENSEEVRIDAKVSKSDGGKSGISTLNSTSGINNASTASLASKVREEQEERNKKRSKNDNLSSLFTKSATNGTGKNNDFMSRGFAIPARQQR